MCSHGSYSQKLTTWVITACCVFAVPATAAGQTQPPARVQQMFHAIRLDAHRIFLASERLRNSARAADFAQAGEELNAIEPAVADLEVKLDQLKDMPLKNALSYKRRLNDSAPIINSIDATTDRLRTLLDRHGPIVDPRVIRTAQSLARKSQELVDAASAAGPGLS